MLLYVSVLHCPERVLENIICASVGILAMVGRTEVQGGGLRVFRVAGSVGGVGEVLA